VRFFEAVQQLRELPQWEWAIVRSDLAELDGDALWKATGSARLVGFSFLQDELLVVEFDELYRTAKQRHSKHWVSWGIGGPNLSDLDSIEWMLTRAGGTQ
jgi:hypothetical protein